MVKTIESLDEFQALINGSEPVVVDYWATWCGPCKVIGPVFSKLEPKFPGVVFAKVDVDALADVAQAQNIRAMPTFKAYQNGEEFGVVTGAIPAKLEALVKQAHAKVEGGDAAPAA